MLKACCFNIAYKGGFITICSDEKYRCTIKKFEMIKGFKTFCQDWKDRHKTNP